MSCPLVLARPSLPQELAALGDENIKLMELLEGRQVRRGGTWGWLGALRPPGDQSRSRADYLLCLF